MITALACAAAVVLGSPASAETPFMAELRPGWRLPDGDHMAALHLRLAPGWKTYWRAPGDAGIPPLFDWSGSHNLQAVSVLWPTPHVFHQSGMRSVGYARELVLPLRIHAQEDGDTVLKMQVQLGVCKDICLPAQMDLSAVLPAALTRADPMIAAALASAPFSADEAQVSAVRCSVTPVKKGLMLRAEIDMPPAGDPEDTVVESGAPMIWAAPPRTERHGGTLVTEAKLKHVEGRPFVLDRSRLRITVLGRNHAVDIQGCDR
ncbi:protein-disulfide reductase DsbD domain-containing protein [Salipiger marinus]|uniref:protein-disulfide reductase DsbD domain-containing protein n=1 Tax=Salipiger marinus TaxID=555512 RepID=UPI000E982E63|nr:protein-disulfide reductase DsbD domain-containing protein [Salipiger manganoxidans]MCD1618423.1 hypothetical protein [Salipiger manganoxidans]MEB3417980.1 protein-disulfide reductase DsbD domain-containing protein [Salipiger manganoxidans]HBM61536.1 hypothetical protein [Citreicella sp.]